MIAASSLGNVDRSESAIERTQTSSLNFHGERRSNATHQSTTDPDARLARKGRRKEAKLSYAGHVQMDNRHSFVVNTRLTEATGTAELEASLALYPWRR